MTVEEIEIIVTAKVEEALKEFEKFLPAIKKVMKQSLMLVKKQLANLKKSSENNQIKIKITNAEAIQQIRQVKKELDALHKQHTARRYKHKK